MVPPREPLIPSLPDTNRINYIYRDTLNPEWQEWWSWDCIYNLSSTDTVYHGANSIYVNFQPGGVFRLKITPLIKFQKMDILDFYAFGLSCESCLEIFLIDEHDNELRFIKVARFIEDGKNNPQDWSHVIIPLRFLGADDKSIACLLFREAGDYNTEYWIDEIRILGYRPQPPQLVSAELATAYEDSFFIYTAKAIDPEDSVVTYTFQDHPTWLTPADSTIFGIPREGAKDTSFMIIASDGELTDTLKVAVIVIPINDPPQIINLSDFSFENIHSYIINLDSCVVDQDHLSASMLWQITSSDTNLKLILENRIATFKALNWSGTTNVQFKVTDPEGASDSILVNVTVNLPSSISDLADHRPDNFVLKQNYPNPFNPTTTIRYELPRSSIVVLTIYDMLGREILTLVNERQKPGRYAVNFDASKLVSGIYFYKLQSGSDFVEIKKMLALR